MARGELNPIFRKLRRQIGNFIYRQVRGKLIVSKAPDWSRRKRTAAQKAASKLFGEAARRTRTALADGQDKTAYKTKAAKQRIPLAAAVMSDLLAKKR